LGDFICFLPALRELGRAAPVDLFARSEFAEIAPCRVAVRSLERAEISALFRRDSGDDRAQKFFQAYDTVYSWFGSGNPEFVSRLTTWTGGRAQIFRFRPADAGVHQAQYYLRCIDPGADLSALPVLALRTEAVRWCEGFWDEHALQRRPILTIAPGSGSRHKNCPPEFFLRVTCWWRESIGGAVILLIGPVEQATAEFDDLRGHAAVASHLSLSQAAALLRRSDIYLGNDSGITHLAAATGVRTLAIFGPSDPRHWAPRGPRVTVFRRSLGCSPCLEAAMKSCPHHACLKEFNPEQIIAELEQLPEVVTLTT
jgi:hypothetical protein